MTSQSPAYQNGCAGRRSERWTFFLPADFYWHGVQHMGALNPQRTLSCKLVFEATLSISFVCVCVCVTQDYISFILWHLRVRCCFPPVSNLYATRYVEELFSPELSWFELTRTRVIYPTHIHALPKLWVTHLCVLEQTHEPPQDQRRGTSDTDFAVSLVSFRVLLWSRKNGGTLQTLWLSCALLWF